MKKTHRALLTIEASGDIDERRLADVLIYVYELAQHAELIGPTMQREKRRLRDAIDVYRQFQAVGKRMVREARRGSGADSPQFTHLVQRLNALQGCFVYAVEPNALTMADEDGKNQVLTAMPLWFTAPPHRRREPWRQEAKNALRDAGVPPRLAASVVAELARLASTQPDKV